MTVTRTAVDGRLAPGLRLDVPDLNLNDIADLKGSALEAILLELRDDSAVEEHARHSSHSSYSTHGTAMW